MNYNRLGKTDLIISEIGFGCQSIGGGFFYKDHNESIKTLIKAYDKGVNFFDTSDHYTQGESEKLLGSAFKLMRDKILIGTKAGTFYTPSANLLLRQRSLLQPISKYLHSMKIPFHLIRSKQKRSDFSHQYLISSVEKSLKRLQTDYIDLFQLHKPSADILELGEFIETLEFLKRQGKIRYYGISTADNKDSFICFKYPGISSVQITANLLEKKYLNEILNSARQNKIGVISRNPRAQGHLTNELSDIMGETYAKNKKEFEIKKSLAMKYSFLVKPDRTLAQAALQYVLSFDGITTAIPRAVNRKQIDEILGTLNSPSLSIEELEKISLMNEQKVVRI